MNVRKEKNGRKRRRRKPKQGVIRHLGYWSHCDRHPSSHSKGQTLNLDCSCLLREKKAMWVWCLSILFFQCSHRDWSLHISCFSSKQTGLVKQHLLCNKRHWTGNKLSNKKVNGTDSHQPPHTFSLDWNSLDFLLAKTWMWLDTWQGEKERREEEDGRVEGGKEE